MKDNILSSHWQMMFDGQEARYNHYIYVTHYPGDSCGLQVWLLWSQLLQKQACD